MAFYIEIEKSAEREDIAEYKYSTADGRTGRFSIDRRSGQTCLLESAPGEIEERLYHRASFKIKKAWKDGHLPETECWAS